LPWSLLFCLIHLSQNISQRYRAGQKLGKIGPLIFIEENKYFTAAANLGSEKKVGKIGPQIFCIEEKNYFAAEANGPLGHASCSPRRPPADIFLVWGVKDELASFSLA
jgi:hypothetical protein